MSVWMVWWTAYVWLFACGVLDDLCPELDVVLSWHRACHWREWDSSVCCTQTRTTISSRTPLRLSTAVTVHPTQHRLRLLCCLVFTFTRSHIHTFTRSHIHTFTHSHIHTFTRSHIHTFTNSHFQTFTISHIHTFTRSHFVRRKVFVSLLLAMTPALPRIKPEKQHRCCNCSCAPEIGSLMLFAVQLPIIVNPNTTRG